MTRPYLGAQHAHRIFWLSLFGMMAWSHVAVRAQDAQQTGPVRSVVLLSPSASESGSNTSLGDLATSLSLYLGDVGLSVVLGPPAPSGNMAQQMEAAVSIGETARAVAVVWYAAISGSENVLVHVLDLNATADRVITFRMAADAGTARATALKVRSLLAARAAAVARPETPPPQQVTQPGERRVRLLASYESRFHIPSGLWQRGPVIGATYGETWTVGIEFRLLGPTINSGPGAVGRLDTYAATASLDRAFAVKALFLRPGAWVAVDLMRATALDGTSATSATRVAPMLGLSLELALPMGRRMQFWTRLSAGVSLMRQVFRVRGEKLLDSGRLSTGLGIGVAVAL